MKKVYKIIGIIFLIFVAIGVITKEDEEPKKKETKEVVREIVEKVQAEDYRKNKMIIKEDTKENTEIVYELDKKDKEFFYENERNKKIIGDKTVFSEEEFLIAAYTAIEIYKNIEKKDIVAIDIYQGKSTNPKSRIARFAFKKDGMEKTNFASLDIINIYRRYLLIKSDSGVIIMTGAKGSKNLYTWEYIEGIMDMKYSDYDPENYKE